MHPDKGLTDRRELGLRTPGLPAVEGAASVAGAGSRGTCAEQR